MRRLMIALMILAVGMTADAATKKKEDKNKPAAAVKPGREPTEVIIGQLTKEKENGKDVFLITKDGGTKMPISEGKAKSMSINLNDFVGKKIAVGGVMDEASATFKSIRFVKTEADYKKQK